VLADGVEAQWLAWPTPRTENIAIPPRRSTSTAPEIFWRVAPNPLTGANTLTLRWVGNTNVGYWIELSDNLSNWVLSPVGVINLGEGMYQWSAVAGAPRRFHRVVASGP
jgi:hypothetical protein